MHLNQLFVYLLLGIVSGAAGAPVSSNVIASSEFTTGITQSSNVESGSDLDIRTIGALSHPAQIVVPVNSHMVMEARSGNISKGWHLVNSDEDDEDGEEWEEIGHPEAAHPTKSTAAAHPKPPPTSAKVPEQKPKGPEPKTRLVSLLSYTWVGIETAHIGSGRVSQSDILIHGEAFKLVREAAESKWKLTNCFINRDNPFMYPAVVRPATIKTTEFKFLLQLKYDHGGQGTNYCEGRVEGEPKDGCIGIIRWGKDESGKSRISELRNKDGVVAQIRSI